MPRGPSSLASGPAGDIPTTTLLHTRGVLMAWLPVGLGIPDKRRSSRGARILHGCASCASQPRAERAAGLHHRLLAHGLLGSQVQVEEGRVQAV